MYLYCTMNSMEKLGLFFEKIKSIGFWQRLFGWNNIRRLSYDAYEEFSRIEGGINEKILEVERLNEQVSEQKSRIS